jgi:hypothetical protein
MEISEKNIFVGSISCPTAGKVNLTPPLGENLLTNCLLWGYKR